MQKTTTEGMKDVGTFTVAIYKAEEGRCGRPTAVVYSSTGEVDGVKALRDFATAYSSGQGSCVIVDARSGVIVSDDVDKGSLVFERLDDMKRAVRPETPATLRPLVE